MAQIWFFSLVYTCTNFMTIPNINFNFFVFFTIKIILIWKMDVWIDIPVDKYLCGQISMWTNVPVDKCLMDICPNRYFSGGTFVLQPYSGSLCWRKIFPLTWILSHHLMKSFLGKKCFLSHERSLRKMNDLFWQLEYLATKELFLSH